MAAMFSVKFEPSTLCQEQQKQEKAVTHAKNSQTHS